MKRSRELTFLQYLGAFGPGFIMVLTWMGPGDLIETSVSGSNYGYALMWTLVIAIVVRYLFVSLIAKYQLFNIHADKGEGVLDGFGRLNRYIPLLIVVISVLMGHAYCSYMSRGLGEVCVNLFGFGEVWQYSIPINLAVLILLIYSNYGQIERYFKVFVLILAIALISVAIWVKPDFESMALGILTLDVPEKVGSFSASLIALSTIGAVGGSIMNLVYPYFLEDKGWIKPEHRKVQNYDFILAMFVFLILNLSTWAIGAEILNPRGIKISDLNDLPKLLTEVIGQSGRIIFYIGIFFAILSSLVGFALGLSKITTHSYARWKMKSLEGALNRDFQTYRIFKVVLAFSLITSLIWSLPGMPDFVTLTVLVNSSQIVILPLISACIWKITSSSKYMGAHRNTLATNLFMLFLFVLSLWGSYNSVISLLSY